MYASEWDYILYCNEEKVDIVGNRLVALLQNSRLKRAGGCWIIGDQDSVKRNVFHSIVWWWQFIATHHLFYAEIEGKSPKAPNMKE